MTAPSLDGALVLDKPAGITSHDAVLRIRGLAQERRVGHAGTLDPLATGVLILLLGRATRLASLLTAHEKEYEGTIRLGFATTTDDLEGEPLGPCSPSPDSPAEIERAAAGLRGRIAQVPPLFSAKKRAGVPLHRIARRAGPGKEVAAPTAVDVEISRLEVRLSAPGLVSFLAVCSAGTYMRSLARDLGARLGCGAHLESLRRTRSGPFRIADAVLLASLASREDVLARRIPLDDLPPDLPSLRVREEEAADVLHGRSLSLPEEARRRAGATGERARLRILGPRGELLAIAEVAGPGGTLLHPRIVFPPERL